MGAVLVDPGLRHGPGMQGQGDGGLVLRTPVVQGAAPPGRVVPIVWPGGRARCCRAGLWGLEGESEVLFRGRHCRHQSQHALPHKQSPGPVVAPTVPTAGEDREHPGRLVDAEAVVFEFVGPDNVLMTGILQELLDGLVAEGEGVWAPGVGTKSEFVQALFVIRRIGPEEVHGDLSIPFAMQGISGLRVRRVEAWKLWVIQHLHTEVFAAMEAWDATMCAEDLAINRGGQRQKAEDFIHRHPHIITKLRTKATQTLCLEAAIAVSLLVPIDGE
mmetsp:Transcript_53908/g.89755  ORF Transcript_53908/g.89755 Transcript_53908/m.89755 type:complete len:273 (+) Transcript_53908:1378-2196(+)